MPLIALVQFDAVPEKIEHNLAQIERLSRAAVSRGARWVMFHEGCVCDYTPRLEELAEPVPAGPTCQRVEALARGLGVFISVGLSERAEGRYFITQVFFGPAGFVYRYRKSWVWREPSDAGYRNEWLRYDTGGGPELFEIDGVRATCFICADGEAPRCIQRAADLTPQVVFFPNNRSSLNHEDFGPRAKLMGAPMLVTNRVGTSWIHSCVGGCTVYGPDGRELAAANREGREEILLHDLTL